MCFIVHFFRGGRFEPPLPQEVSLGHCFVCPLQLFPRATPSRDSLTIVKYIVMLEVDANYSSLQHQAAWHDFYSSDLICFFDLLLHVYKKHSYNIISRGILLLFYKFFFVLIESFPKVL